MMMMRVMVVMVKKYELRTKCSGKEDGRGGGGGEVVK